MAVPGNKTRPIICRAPSFKKQSLDKHCYPFFRWKNRLQETNLKTKKQDSLWKECIVIFANIRQQSENDFCI